jgi:DNA-binding MarR family transcriptional regulator
MTISAMSPHPFTLRQLQYALAVADLLSFRRAAEVCHVSQPSLSTQIQQVEDGLGVRLFERDRRRVLLTPAGHAVVERARRVVQEADALVAAATQAGDPAQRDAPDRRDPHRVALPPPQRGPGPPEGPPPPHLQRSPEVTHPCSPEGTQRRSWNQRLVQQACGDCSV